MVSLKLRFIAGKMRDLRILLRNKRSLKIARCKLIRISNRKRRKINSPVNCSFRLMKT